jgi:hypothetical protein
LLLCGRFGSFWRQKGQRADASGIKDIVQRPETLP